MSRGGWLIPLLLLFFVSFFSLEILFKGKEGILMIVNYFILDLVGNTGYPILPITGLCFPLLRTMPKCKHLGRNYLPGICLNLNFSGKFQPN